MKKLYNVKDSIRYYNIYNVSEIDLFYSELSIFCNNWVGDGGNLFFFENTPHHNITLTKEEMDFIYLLDQGCKNFEYLDINNNVSYLMENQKNDLLLLGLENINYLFLIPKFDKKNRYYYNLLISFKNDSVYNNLFNLNFNIISIEKFNRIENLSFLDIKNIFNFENSKFSINKFDYRFNSTLNIDSKKKKINIKVPTDEEEQKFIDFLCKYDHKRGVNNDESLKLEIKNILSQYLIKPSIDVKLKKISYFFYWNVIISDIFSGKNNYCFVLDDETGYSICYALHIDGLCYDFKLNTYLI